MPKCYIKDVLPLGELSEYAQKGGVIGSLYATLIRPSAADYFLCHMTMAALAEAPYKRAQHKALAQMRWKPAGGGRHPARRSALSSATWADTP